MDLQLNKVNYIQVGPVDRKCAYIMLNTDKTAHLTQKLAIGDRNGILQIFGIKKYQAKITFKIELGVRVTSVVLGGVVGAVKDKVFAACGTEVMGYSKKGKQFMQFNTGLADPIENMFVEGPHLLVTGRYLYHRYENLENRESYMSPDQVNSMLCLPSDKFAGRIIAVLACRDRILRIVENSDVQYEMELSSPACVLSRYCGDGGINGGCIVYGAVDGSLGLVELTENTAAQHWELNPDNGERSAVSCISFHDLTGDGNMEMLVGRDGGDVEVYRLDDLCTDSVRIMEPVLIFEMNCNQTVTSVHGAKFSNSNNAEIVCTTFSGWVFGLTPETNIKSVDNTGKLIIDPDLTAKIDELRNDVIGLNEAVLNREKELLSQDSKKTLPVTSVQSGNISSSGDVFSHRFTLAPREAAYLLTVESQVSIDCVLVQSDTAIDLLDTDKNSAVVSFSQVNAEDGNSLLATFRCQVNTTRLEIKVRSIEGQYGTIRVYVAPKTVLHTCQLLTFPVRPLSLHKRAHKLDESRPFSWLSLRGSFSVAEMHSWIVFCLPETPEKVGNPSSTDSDNRLTLVFESTFLGSQLHCSYRRGEVIFKSDNLSTISILKDVLTKEATKKAISLDINYETNESSVEHLLRFIHPKIESLLLLAKKVQLIEPLRELVNNEQHQTVGNGDTLDAVDQDFLSPEYREIVNNAESLRDEFKRQPCHLERLYGIITDLYIDKFKFQGQDARGNVKDLIELLDNYKLEDLINFFNIPID